MLPGWWKNWTGDTALVVASGPSAEAQGVEQARGRVKAIAVNYSWKLAPWADILLANDATFWEVYQGVPLFKGLKLTADGEAMSRNPGAGIELITVDPNHTDELVLDTAGIFISGNSGFTAINIAVQFGAKRILLVGFDCALGKNLHWHGPHGNGLGNPDIHRVTRWRRILDAAAPVLAARGVEVINCSDVSALTAYPKMTLRDALWLG
jgi:hypothetical protein